jgi:ABC-type polysaccharide/polyol phosphate export permease
VTSLSGNFNLVTKIYFPREIIPLSGVAIHFIDYLIGLAVYFLLLFCYQIPLTWNILWMIPLLVMLVLYTTSISLLLAALNVYYRDVKLASTFLLQFLFFATPVIYSIDAVDNRWKMLLFLNPLTFIVENMRRVTIEGRGILLWQLAVEMLGIIVLYLIIYRIFIRIERAFADVI